MPPDLNTLPVSRSPSTPSSPVLTSLRRTSSNQVNTLENNPPSPRSPTLSSLQATAAINAVRQRTPEHSRPSMAQEGRRSSFITNLSLQDPATTSPIERPGSSGSPQLFPATRPRSPLMNTADPHHQRAPSLGQIHQQLENEQEAQVNRLLNMIRVQQDQLSALQAEQTPATAASGSEPASAAATSDVQTTPDVARVPAAPAAAAAGTTHSRTPSMGGVAGGAYQHPAHRSPLQRPTSMSRQSSRGGGVALVTSSITSSPSLRPLSSTRSHDEWSMGGTRDDSAFYQAETQMLQRENQMLQMRVRDLERQIADMNASSTADEAKPAAASADGSALASSST